MGRFSLVVASKCVNLLSISRFHFILANAYIQTVWTVYQQRVLVEIGVVLQQHLLVKLSVLSAVEAHVGPANLAYLFCLLLLLSPKLLLVDELLKVSALLHHIFLELLDLIFEDQNGST